MPKIELPKGRDLKLLKKLENQNVFSQSDIRKMMGYEIRTKDGRKSKEYLDVTKRLKILEQNGQIEKIGKRGNEVLYKIDDILLKKLRELENKEIKFTAFDKNILDILDDNGKVDIAKLKAHPKKDSIAKRLDTFRKNEILKKDESGFEFIDKNTAIKIEKVITDARKKAALKLERTRKLELSPFEETVIKDINRFGMLTHEQIKDFIGDISLEALIKENVIEYNEKFHVFVLGKKGEKYAKALDITALKYKTKTKGRLEEVEHDKLVYQAYRTELSRLLKMGAKIKGTYTDRELRRIEAKKYGHIVNSLPDFRIEYYLKGYSGECRLDIEIDIGYKDKVISQKIMGMKNAAKKANISPQNHSILWVKKGSINSKTRIYNINSKTVTRHAKARKIKKALRVLKAVNKLKRNFKQKKILRPKKNKESNFTVKTSLELELENLI